MKVYRVCGSVTLSRCHPSYEGAVLRAIEPEGHSTLGGPAPKDPDLLVMWDERGSGLGSQVAVSDGAEAAQAFRPALKPVDAYCSAILDQIHVKDDAVKQLKLG
ncbi:MAG: EutN/CcmL family microcompartment protein [Pirellulaceae bacterium]